MGMPVPKSSPEKRISRNFQQWTPGVGGGAGEEKRAWGRDFTLYHP